jgi:hypothetical protein
VIPKSKVKSNSGYRSQSEPRALIAAKSKTKNKDVFKGKFIDKSKLKAKKAPKPKIKNAANITSQYKSRDNSSPGSSLNPNSKLDTRRPSLFSDEPVHDVLSRAKKVSDLKNLGPVSEAEFAKIGIVSARQFIKLGWKKTMKKLVELNPKNRHSLFAYALIGALTNTEYSRISEAQKNEAKAFVHSLPRPVKQNKSRLKK